ncbi:MAG: DNA primase [Gammaproteobacteria bacterium]|nr:DNA primase [Gammaproteobacteria bacterium]MDH3507511.1 DNA primase [Gammaproteobacteria bacterium]
MSQRIPQSFIDDLIARADIVEIVGNRVSLTKAGREYKAVCPFHAEKTPSFTVSPTKGFYHCFGCGAHGTALGFLMQYDNLEFLDAVEALADICSVAVPKTTTSEERAPTHNLFDLLGQADALYRQTLRDSQTAIDYLKARGIDGQTAARFGMGYAPDAWDTVLKALGTSPAHIEHLRDAGLVIKNEQGRQYDRFRDRIMFPIRDPRGRVLGFGGRVLGSGEPKYLNSPETPVFHKGQALYGLYEARQGQGRPERILVVEGYLDVASLAQHGIEPVVATLGTATTAEHIRRLTRLADRVVFCFDGDRAGRAAAWRALETALPMAGGKIEIHFLLLPEGHDPDSLVREKGKAHFESLIAAALPLSNFVIEELAQRVDLGSADGQSRLAALVEPLLAQLPDGVYRDRLLEQLAERLGTSTERLGTLLDAPPPAPAPRASAQTPTRTLRSTLVRKALTLAVHHPEAAAQIGPIDGLERVDQPGITLLCQVLEVTAAEPKINTAGLLERFRHDAEGRYLGQLAAAAPLDDEAAAAEVLRDCAERIVAAFRRERLSALLTRGSSLSDAEKTEIRELQAASSRQSGFPEA